jgi:hypothetical protein
MIKHISGAETADVLENVRGMRSGMLTSTCTFPSLVPPPLKHNLGHLDCTWVGRTRGI